MVIDMNSFKKVNRLSTTGGALLSNQLSKKQELNKAKYRHIEIVF